MTKLAGEMVALQAAAGSNGFAVTVVQPGIVFGKGDDFSKNLAAAVKHAPVFPLPWPSGPLAVVHVNDVAAAVMDEAIGETWPRQSGSRVRVIEVVGPEVAGLDGLVQLTAKGLQLRCHTLPIPAMAMVPVVWMLEHLPLKDRETHDTMLGLPIKSLWWLSLH
eukprot:SAG31_NODE_11753_length_1001_cov_0.995565_2_plen_163_part_00